MSVELVILAGVDPAAACAAHPLAHSGPARRFQYVIKPKPLALFRTERFTDTHVAQRYAGLIHQVIEWVTGESAFGKPGPDISGFPVINRVGVPRVAPRR